MGRYLDLIRDPVTENLEAPARDRRDRAHQMRSSGGLSSLLSLPSRIDSQTKYEPETEAATLFASALVPPDTEEKATEPPSPVHAPGLASTAATKATEAIKPAQNTCSDVEEERAGIMECSSGISLSWAEGLARLHPDSPPRDVPLRRWQTFVDDCGTFLDGGWAKKAAALGWGPLDLWRELQATCARQHETNGLAREGAM